MTLSERIAELRELEKRATPGPWPCEPTGDHKRITIGKGLVEGPNGYAVAEVYSDDCPWEVAEANARFITAMRNHLPHLLEALSAPRDGGLERAIAAIIQDACELPDRTSPDDQPEMLLITGDELDMLLRRHLGLEDAALSHPARPAEGVVDAREILGKLAALDDSEAHIEDAFERLLPDIRAALLKLGEG